MSTSSLTLRSVLVAAVASALATPSAQAVLPPDQVVEYHLRENPADPQSAVLVTIRLELSAVDQDASTVGWEITHAHFDQYTSLGEPVASWSIERPEVDTVDGLWWVAHEHPEEPSATDFTTAPSVSGAAPRVTGTGPDLLFSLAPGALASQYQSYYGGAVAGLTYALQEEGDEDDLADGQSEPAEVQ